MPRTDPLGVTHPAGSDLYDVTDGKHVSQCPTCLTEPWGPQLAEAWRRMQARP